MPPGFFISLDGLDGTGKSTQCRLLAERLRRAGHTVLECGDPGGTAVGDVLRGLVLEHRGEMALRTEALLFMASRAQLTAEKIRPALDAGHVAVSDRYSLANVVYQGHGGGLDAEELWRIASFATAGLEPDLTIVLDLAPGAARERRNRPADRMESRADEFHERVRNGFLAEAARRPDRIRVVDASADAETVHERIWEEVARVMGSCPRS